MTSSTSRRIRVIERLVSAAECACNAPENQVVCVAVEPGWSEERMRHAEEAVRPRCPIHGPMQATMVRLSGSDFYL